MRGFAGILGNGFRAMMSLGVSWCIRVVSVLLYPGAKLRDVVLNRSDRQASLRREHGLVTGDALMPSAESRLPTRRGSEAA